MNINKIFLNYFSVCLIFLYPIFTLCLSSPSYAGHFDEYLTNQNPKENVSEDKSNEKIIEESTEIKSEESSNELKEIDNIGILKGHVSKVPGGTKLRIFVETPLDEITNKAGDEFTARVAEDIIIDSKVVVPLGSTVVGTISEINPAKRLHKAGSVRIEFKGLTTPDGRQLPIVASVLSRSGLLKGRFTPKKALLAGATLAVPAAVGVGAGLVADGSPLGVGIGAALGALAGIALYSFQRGNMVDIKAGDELNIELTEDALVPTEVVKNEDSKNDNEGSKIEQMYIDSEHK